MWLWIRTYIGGYFIDAFHSNWTAPYFSFNDIKRYSIEDFEILTTILSALKWRQQNGRIKMVTDKIGQQYYKDLGIEKIWDLGIDNTLDEEIKGIDTFLFWAAGKIFALQKQNIPIAMIDTDFIVWKPLEAKLKNLELCTIHRENIYDDIYPDKNKFDMKPNYKFDENWDWSVLPCNTAFTYIANNEFKQYYTQESINFMRNTASGHRIINMVFAEQRLISMCAKKMNIGINTLSDLKALAKNQSYFTHTWGYKDVMKNDFSKRNDFCIRCIKRIITDFPEYENIIANIEKLYNYYVQYKRTTLN